MTSEARSVASDTVGRRVLLLYGLYMLASNSAYLFGYTMLPERFMAGSPHVAAGRLVAGANSPWSQTWLM